MTQKLHYIVKDFRAITKDPVKVQCIQPCGCLLKRPHVFTKFISMSYPTMYLSIYINYLIYCVTIYYGDPISSQHQILIFIFLKLQGIPEYTALQFVYNFVRLWNVFKFANRLSMMQKGSSHRLQDNPKGYAILCRFRSYALYIY